MDRADRLTDAIERRTLKTCEELYAQALKSAMRKAAPVFKQLKELDERKPPSHLKTTELIDKWREDERRKILRKTNLADLVAKEVAKAGEEAALVIRRSMDDIDRINRVVEDIGN